LLTQPRRACAAAAPPTAAPAARPPPSARRRPPAAASPALATLLEALQAEPGDHRPLAEWAASVHMTERTLARKCQRELGMSGTTPEQYRRGFCGIARRTFLFVRR
jgi:transcriptional regulator GlxA family with amidase domain